MTLEVGGSSGLNNALGNGNTRMTLTALVVDDDENARRAFVEILQTHGYETSVVNDGRQAIDLFQSGKQFDVIFLETKPSLNGLQTTRHLREIGVRSMIVGIEAFTNRLDWGEFRESGMNIFYEKSRDYPSNRVRVCHLSVALLHNEIEKKKRNVENVDV